MENNLGSYPITRHFSESQLATKVENFKNGEKSLWWFLKLGAMIAIAYATWVYILPPIFRALGDVLAKFAVAGTVVAIALLIPVIFKWLRVFARWVAERAIEQKPFLELEGKAKEQVQMQRDVRSSKGVIQGLATDAEVDADKNEKDAKSLQTQILSLNRKATALKTSLDEMIKTGGKAATGTDDYINTKIAFDKALSDAQRFGYQLTQCKDFVQKYGSRSAIMKKTVQKLTMVDAGLDIKILDFQATIDMLKKDYEFAEKMKNATDKAKRALGVEKQWEVEFALGVITTTIAQDIAITSGNLKDIDALTKNFALDSDEMYANLNALADNINTGNDVIPEAKVYKNPEYQLTADDKTKSGGLSNIFD